MFESGAALRNADPLAAQSLNYKFKYSLINAI